MIITGPKTEAEWDAWVARKRGPYRKRPPDPEKFWALVDKTPHPDKCWIWEGRILKAKRAPVGYGQFSWEGHDKSVHIIAWEIHHNRRIPFDRHIDHICFNRLCVNPAHLRAVTPQQNANNRYPLADLGVHRYKHEFLVAIQQTGTAITIGIYPTSREAVQIALRHRRKQMRCSPTPLL